MLLARSGVVVFCLVLAALRPALADEDTAKRRYRAVRVTTTPVIDGRFDDACWTRTEWSRGFVQREPHEGTAPTQETAFQVVYDERNLYVAIRAYDTEPSSIERRVTRRDDRQGDQVEIFLDSYFDHQTAFVFNVNSAGVRTDYVLSSDGDNEDDSWDAVWHAKVSLDEDGWSAELVIPFSQLRFAEAEASVWGVQVRRFLHRREELSEWQPIPQDASGFVSAFGELHGLADISAKRQIELLPYAVAKAERFERSATDPFATGRRNDFTGGLDGRLAVTSDLMLTFTINPDFGQVEADPSEVNLTTFETFFQERRPFFIESRNIFDFALQPWGNRTELFYSRRIGRAPQRSPKLEDEEFYDAPDNATILGAFKLTGKTRGGWSVGFLDSLTSAEYAEIDRLGERRRESVEPFTNYFAGRVQKDFSKGRTIFGGMLTSTNRAAESADLGLLHRAAYTGGVDLLHTWHDRDYFVSAKGVFSQVDGSAATISETQRSSTRYFQRPDADYVEVDDTRTALAGHGGTLEIGKEGGGHLRFNGRLSWNSPGLELNDVGFMRVADEITQWASVGWRIWEPFSIFRSFNVNVNQSQVWDFGGTHLGGFRGGNVDFQLRNYWGFATGLFAEGDRISNQALRGGPSMTFPSGVGNWFNLRSDNRRALRFNFGAFNFWGEEARAQNFWIGATYRPASAIAVSIEPYINDTHRELQYVDTAELQDAESRYVMGRLDQTTVGVTLRLNYSVSPNLSIQFYGQPFLSSGSYDQFKRITEPRAEMYEDRFALYAPDEISYDSGENAYEIVEASGASYSFSNPDFDFRQFRGNLVVRWEYQPGSTLFFVWSQDRTREDELGQFSFREGFRDLFREHAFNVFLVKFTYRFSI